MAEDRVKSAMGSGEKKKSKKKSSKKGKKPVHSMNLRKLASGHVLASHQYEPDASGATPPAEEHSVPMEEIGDHVQSHFGAAPEEPAAPAAPPMGM